MRIREECKGNEEKEFERSKCGHSRATRHGPKVNVPLCRHKPSDAIWNLIPEVTLEAPSRVSLGVRELAPAKNLVILECSIVRLPRLRRHQPTE